MKWQNKLTKKELEHFRYATKGTMTLEAFRCVRQEQRKIDPIVCPNCSPSWLGSFATFLMNQERIKRGLSV